MISLKEMHHRLLALRMNNRLTDFLLTIIYKVDFLVSSFIWFVVVFNIFN